MNPKKKLPLTRRAFMAKSACSAMGLTGMVNTLAHMKLMQGALANSSGSLGDYKALVVLFLFGAKDANNFLMPGLLHPGRSNYNAHRGVLALPTGGNNPTHPIVAANLAAERSAPVITCMCVGPAPLNNAFRHKLEITDGRFFFPEKNTQNIQIQFLVNWLQSYS